MSTNTGRAPSATAIPAAYIPALATIATREFRSDADPGQRELERIGAVRDGDGVAGAAEGGELSLEGRHALVEDVETRAQDAQHGGVELVTQPGVLPLQIVERDRHHGAPGR